MRSMKPHLIVLGALAAAATAAEFSNIPRSGYAPAVAEALAVVVELRTTGEDAGSGSGVVVDVRGYCLTCFHVVRGAVALTIDFGEERVPALVVASDEFLDLALVKVDRAFPKAVRWGNSANVRAGDVVIAVGYPFDIGELASLGIISAVGFKMEYPVFVLDAAINPGNSGGGLFDTGGRLVGIPHRLHAAQGLKAYTGIGFAIPGNTARLFVNRNVPVP